MGGYLHWASTFSGCQALNLNNPNPEVGLSNYRVLGAKLTVKSHVNNM
ncbi:MAG: hypothetical protein F6J98_06960 [Moorea sp. SIO4G2]|nr:hypothetical protein [Moorena sp. SIO4G2]